MWIKTLLLFLKFSFIFGYDRQIHSSINSNCTTCNIDNITLFYVKAIGQSDVIHQLWDFTLGKPTIVFMVSDIDTELNISWKNNLPDKFFMSSEPKYSFALVLDKIWEFNDTSDSATIDPDAKETVELDTQYLKWERIAMSQEESEAMLSMVAYGYNDGVTNKTGAFRIKLDLLPFSDYAIDLPHLIHSANSTQVDIELENVSTNAKYNNSRFALEFLWASSNRVKEHITVNMREGLDDEHTPGIFKIVEVTSPKNYNNHGGYMQYRPVAYVQPERDVGASTEVQTGPHQHKQLDNNSMPYTLLVRDIGYRELLVEKLNVSLGSRGDGFYKNTNYTVWSLSLGYGSPPLEKFSFFVVMVICLGLGVPVLLLISGFVFIFIRRRKQAANNPQRLQ